MGKEEPTLWETGTVSIAPCSLSGNTPLTLGVGIIIYTGEISA